MKKIFFFSPEVWSFPNRYYSNLAWSISSAKSYKVFFFCKKYFTTKVVNSISIFSIEFLSILLCYFTKAIPITEIRNVRKPFYRTKFFIKKKINELSKKYFYFLKKMLLIELKNKNAIFFLGDESGLFFLSKISKHTKKARIILEILDIKNHYTKPTLQQAISVADTILYTHDKMAEDFIPAEKEKIKVVAGYRLPAYSNKENNSVPTDFNVVYAGIFGERIDLKLMCYLADNAIPITVIGPLYVEDSPKGKATEKAFFSFVNRKNVHYIEHMSSFNSHKQLSQYSLAIIPYTKSTFNLYCTPTKLFEYLRAGLPVVSTTNYFCEEHKKLHALFTVANDQKDFLEKINSMKKQDNPKLRKKRKLFSLKHSLDNKTKQLYEIFEQ